MDKKDEPRDDREKEPEDSGNSNSWLDELASGVGSIWDETESETNPAGDDLLDGSTNDEIPDWLKADLEKDDAVEENVPEWMVSELEANGTSQIGDDATLRSEPRPESDGEHIETPTDDDRTLLIESVEPSSGEDAGDDKLNWLDQMSDMKGAEVDEQQADRSRVPDQTKMAPIEKSENEDQTLIGESAADFEMEMHTEDSEPDEGMSAETKVAKDHLTVDNEEDRLEGSEVRPDEVPEDPDEAMAWLEKLAAKQGAPMEELPSMHEESAVNIEPDSGAIVEDGIEEGSTTPIQSSESDQISGEVVEEPPIATSEESIPATNDDTLIFGLTGFTAEDVVNQAGQEPDDEADIVATEIPDDPDEAMMWIEELSARQSAPSPEPISTDNDLMASIDEPPLEGEHEVVQEELTPDLVDFELPGELDEALNWLEQMVDLDEGDPADPVEIVEEQPTPQSVHNVSMAIEEASTAEDDAKEQELESPGLISSPEDEEPTEETAEAFAWLDHLAESGSDLPEDLVAPETDDQLLLEPDEFEAPVLENLDSLDSEAPTGLESEREEVGMPTLESQEPVFDPVEDPIAHRANDDAIDKDMAWLDTLGAVRAEEWITAEGEFPVQDLGSSPVGQEADEDKAITGDEVTEDSEALTSDIVEESVDDSSLEKILEDSEQEQLAVARSALNAGQVLRAMEHYDSLLDDDSSIPFVISDLEASLEREREQVLVQRTLGDAYVRNGQFKRALEVYRQALDNL